MKSKADQIHDINGRYAARFGEQYRLVFGAGNESAALMLVGEAPGKQEEQQGRPFVGPAGKNLDEFLQAVGLERPALYITNAVKFRPTKPGKGTGLVNRTPTREEAALFRPWLMEEIAAIRPRVIATLGNTALCSVLGQAAAIGQAHGAPMPLEGMDGVALFPLYHPASVIYRRELRTVYGEDLVKLRDFLAGEWA